MSVFLIVHECLLKDVCLPTLPSLFDALAVQCCFSSEFFLISILELARLLDSYTAGATNRCLAAARFELYVFYLRYPYTRFEASKSSVFYRLTDCLVVETVTRADFFLFGDYFTVPDNGSYTRTTGRLPPFLGVLLVDIFWRCLNECLLLFKRPCAGFGLFKS